MHGSTGVGKGGKTLKTEMRCGGSGAGTHQRRPAQDHLLKWRGKGKRGSRFNQGRGEGLQCDR